MTREKVKQLLEFGRTLKEELVVVTKAKLRVFVDFSDEEYEDTYIDNHYLYVWNTTFNSWNLVPLEDIKCIEFH
jgi:hypothetical protein